MEFQNLNNNFFDFIDTHLQDDSIKLLLSKRADNINFPLEFAVLQIEGRKKYSQKLSQFLSNKRFLFPDSISGEQASHQAVANYHASLIKENDNVLDMTSGLGIDSMCMARKASKVTAIDLDNLKFRCLVYNSKACNLHNITVKNEDSVEFLNKTEDNFDVIFIDPSRRGENYKRLYGLHDCLPDVISLQDRMKEKSERVLIKASPLIDLTQTMRDLQNIKTIKAIGVKGECKEILIELDFSMRDDAAPVTDRSPLSLEAIDLNAAGDLISYFKSEYIFENGRLSENCEYDVPMAKKEDLKPGNYLLEPSAMVMKTKPWKQIAKIFKAKKFENSSNLFLTEKEVEKFPGRITKIERILTNKDRKALKDFPATVISKNYPLSSDELRKKFKLKEGDRNFIYATSIESKPVLILSSQI